MRRGLRTAAVLCLAAGLVNAQEPRRSDVEERVRVDLVQIEVTAWPESGDPAECRDLTADDFELRVGGRAREIYALDRVSTIETTIEGIPAEPATEPPDEDAEPPLTMVLFFDLWHLNLFHRAFTCPMTKPLAFEQARRMVRESFHPGDRLLLVTFAGWPVVHHGWIRDPDEALAALDRLEVNPAVLSVRRMHSHENALIDGIKSLYLALGRYPGRKEVLYLADDLAFGDLGTRFLEIAARAQANGISTHAVDLLDACRSIPGPPCTKGYGGLGCTPWARPLGIGYLATHGGGRVFADDDIAEIVREVRRMQGCRYLLAFRKKSNDKKRRDPKMHIRLTRKGLSLLAPTSFQLPGRAPQERDEQDALFLLPHFGHGLVVDAGLWPLRPNGKKNGWRAVMLMRLQRVPRDEWPADASEIVVDAAVHRGGKIYGEVRKIVDGADFEALRDGAGSKLLVVPLDDIRPGETTLVARAWTGEDEVAANVRMTYEVPEPPVSGEARPWFLVDGVARVGAEITLLPALDGVLQRGNEGMILGYGCPTDPEQFGGGKLVSFDGERMEHVAIDWLEDREDTTDDSCGWLVGRIDPEIAAGLWRFEPPPALTADDEAGAWLEFRIAGD
ncbi:MAG: hypothetical protein GY716_13545 [bacterium]|nr:hypothetical protein [bacterium]